MSSARPRRRFIDIVENIDRIAGFIEGMDRNSFAADLRTRLAVERCLLIIAEAAVKLGDLAEPLAPGVPWRNVRGIGNILRHDYDAIDVDVLWDTVESHLVRLRDACVSALEQDDLD